MRLAGFAALAAVAVAGCGEDRIDTAKLERELGRQIEAQTPLGLLEVVCPKDVEVSTEGFECTIRAEGGGEVQVPVSQDGEGNLSFRTPDLRALGDASSPGGE